MHRPPRIAALALTLAASGMLAAQEGNPLTLRPVPFPRVQVPDPCIAPRRATNTKVTLAHALQQLEATGTLGNFDLTAAGPLASRGTHHRREWFGCACCPPNLARTFAAVGGYAYATGADGHPNEAGRSNSFLLSARVAVGSMVGGSAVPGPPTWDWPAKTPFSHLSRGHTGPEVGCDVCHEVAGVRGAKTLVPAGGPRRTLAVAPLDPRLRERGAPSSPSASRSLRR